MLFCLVCDGKCISTKDHKMECINEIMNYRLKMIILKEERL